MRIVPLTQKEANWFVKEHHEHHKPVVGSRFQIGLKSVVVPFGEEILIGVAMCGRPVGHKIDQYNVLEINRHCVLRDRSYPNAASKLYGACARIAKEMGFYKIITYVLESETGVSLKAAGWFIEKEKAGGKSWNSSGDRIRTNVNEQGELKFPEEYKTRWAKHLNPEPIEVIPTVFLIKVK